MSYLSHHHPNQNPLNPATCVSFKFLKVVLVSGVLSRNEDRFLVTVSVREGELLHRLFLASSVTITLTVQLKGLTKGCCRCLSASIPITHPKPGSVQWVALRSQQSPWGMDLNKDPIGCLPLSFPNRTSMTAHPASTECHRTRIHQPPKSGHSPLTGVHLLE